MWRYIVQRVPDGSFLEWNLPLADVSITSSLSGPGRLSGTLPIEVSTLKGPDGRPLLEPWGVAIWAEADGEIRGGGILAQVDFDGQKAVLDCTGISGYPHGMPWTAEEYAGVQVDPLSIVRRIWDHLQSQPDGDLGVTVDGTTSPIRVGEEVKEVEFTTGEGEEVSFESGPYRLNYWSTDDLGKAIDDLAEGTPFDYLEHTAWDGEELAHRIQLAYPRLGSRRDDLRFVVGENVIVTPQASLVGDDFASEVLVLGAGEGRDMVRSHLTTETNRLRRVAVVADKSARSKTAATRTARAELDWRKDSLDFTSITVRDHPNAPIGSWRVGDSIRLLGNTGWLDLDYWARIVESTISPDKTGMAQLSVIPE